MDDDEDYELMSPSMARFIGVMLIMCEYCKDVIMVYKLTIVHGN